MKNKELIFCVMALLVSSLVVVGCAQPAPAPAPAPAPKPAEVIVIKGISAMPINDPSCKPVQPFIDAINERLKGEVRIEWVGGPEVVKGFDQPNAVKSGMIDMLFHLPAPYSEALMPVCTAEGQSQLTPWEERESGAYELWVEVYAKFLNARYIGVSEAGAQQGVFLNKRVEKVADFQGLIMRGPPQMDPTWKALGASPVTIPLPEVYTAMERGVIDGFTSAVFAPEHFGLQEVTKYLLEPGVGQAVAIRLMNLDVWNRLPKHAQDVIIETMIEFEHVGVENTKEIVAEAMKVYVDAGMEILSWPPDETKKLHDIHYNAQWEQLFRKDPEYAPRFREVLSK